MNLREYLQNQRGQLVKGWIGHLVDTYPEETARFIRRTKDRFHNPVGYTIETELERIYSILVEEWDEEALNQALDNIIRLRALQGFSPGGALEFVFALKGLARAGLPKDQSHLAHDPEFIDFEAKIDRLALMAFDIYSGCREELGKLKVQEMQRNTFMLLRRAGMLVDQKDPEPNGDDQNNPPSIN